MKKFWSMLLAAGLLLSLSVPALADADTVTDAYAYTDETRDYGGEYRIPQINLPGPGAMATNAAIWEDLYDGYMYDVQHAAESGEWYYTAGIDYTWTVYGDILSLLATVRYMSDDLCDYYVYNVSLTDGERLSDREFFAAMGIDRSGFNDRLRAAVNAQYDAFAEFTDGGFLELQRTSTLADETIARAKPYLDNDGDLCAAAEVYPVAGPERCWQLYDLAA